MLADSGKFRKAGASDALKTFLGNQSDRLLARLGRDDHDVLLKRVKVVCG